MNTTPNIATLAEHRHGRRALRLNTPQHMEEWAARYRKAQNAIERDRLRKGLAKHRAHRRVILTSEPPKTAA